MELVDAIQQVKQFVSDWRFSTVDPDSLPINALDALIRAAEQVQAHHESTTRPDDLEVGNAYTTSPAHFQANTVWGYKLVAWVFPKGSPTEWCVFRGPAEWSWEAVRDNGDEIPEDVARKLFPSMGRMFQRYGNF